MQLAVNFFIFLAIFKGLALAKPALRVENDPELTAGYEEGDMVLDTMLLRNGLRKPVYRWPNNTVYYKFFTEFDGPHKNHILRGMQILESVSCLRFKEAEAGTKAFVNITGFPGGCYSYVGYGRRGAQSYNLAIAPVDSGCFRLGTIVHEFLHTLGFYHMQSAADRDDYVRIVEENIAEYARHNFNKYSDKTVDHYDEEYDYGSVMHYPATAFSINGEKTIVALKDDGSADNMGQRRGMSKKDINKLNVMYRCPVKH
nr:seminal metalloprotease 1 [Exorista sorbillans]